MKNSLYNRELTFNNLLSVYKTIIKTCKNKKKIIRFDMYLYANIYSILKHLSNKSYKPMRYNIFCLRNEKKRRIIMSQEITDKIVNHFVAKFYLIPLLEHKLIDQNCATREGKGTSYANKLVLNYLSLLNSKKIKVYALKIDIHKYFYSIDLNILMNKLKKDIKDEDILWLINVILREVGKYYVIKEEKNINDKYNLDIPLYSYNNGLSIGAMTSQFLAIYYLNDVDHFIKEDLHCKYYVRYQDDLVIFDTDKNRLNSIFNKIVDKIKELNININSKSNIYSLNNGFNYVGTNYRIVNNKLKLNPCRDTNKRTKNNLKHKHDFFEFISSYASY